MTVRHLFLAIPLVAAGCDLIGPVSRPATRRAAGKPSAVATAVGGSPLDPADPPAAAGMATIHLDVYLLDVPAGAVSRDESLWRAVDENAAGVFAGQRLLANGVRCGVARRAEWARMSATFAKELSRARRTKVNGLSMQTVELAVDQPVDREDLFVLGADGQWAGQTYDHATNGLAMTFGPTPRVNGSVRLSVCPIVKRERRRLEFTPLNQPYDVPTDDVDRLYDAALTADVPADSFFLLAPGPLADPADLTVGGRFLVRRDPAAEREQVIVAVPTVVPLDGSRVTVQGK